MQAFLSLIARFMGPTWGLSGADRTQVGPCWPHEHCYLGCYAYQCSWYIEGEARWPPFRRRHFQTHIREWKCYNFDWNFNGDKPLSETMMVRSRTHTCIAQPERINSLWIEAIRCAWKYQQHMAMMMNELSVNQICTCHVTDSFLIKCREWCHIFSYKWNIAA